MINKKNSLLATTQRQGIQNINTIRILACLKENINALNIFRALEVLAIAFCWALIFKWS